MECKPVSTRTSQCSELLGKKLYSNGSKLQGSSGELYVKFIEIIP